MKRTIIILFALALLMSVWQTLYSEPTKAAQKAKKRPPQYKNTFYS